MSIQLRLQSTLFGLGILLTNQPAAQGNETTAATIQIQHVQILPLESFEERAGFVSNFPVSAIVCHTGVDLRAHETNQTFYRLTVVCTLQQRQRTPIH